MIFKTVISINKNHILNGIIFIGFIYFAILLIDVPIVTPIWENFSDPNDYRGQSEIDLFSKRFFITPPWKGYTVRPFTIPLLFKLASSSFERMFIFQKIIYCLCVFAFIVSVLKFLKNSYLKIIATFLFLFFFTWWSIVGWSQNILSESISFSFFLLWMAVLFSYYRSKTIIKLISLIVITVLFSFTRDTWPYLILLFFGMMFLFEIRTKASKQKWGIVLVVFSIFLFIFQNHTVSVGERTVLPVFNNLAGRIAQNSEYLNWFSQKGMPQREQLKADFGNVVIDSREGKAIIYNRYYDSTYTELFKWIELNGKNTYQFFLLTHFQYLSLNDQNLDQLQRIFSSTTNIYYSKPYKFFHNANNVFPLFNVYVALIFVLICVFLWYKSRELYLLLPAFFSLFLLVNVYLSYNADAMEVERHLYLTTIGIELFSLLSLIFIANYTLKERFLVNNGGGNV